MTRLMGTALANTIIATEPAKLSAQLAAAGLISGARPVIVLIGGAANMTPEQMGAAAGLIRVGVMQTAQRVGAAVVDGGTATGVMALAGRARHELGASAPLVGVAPLSKVRASDIPGATGDVDLEANHTHFVLTPGDRWGDELAWLVDLATQLSAGGPIAAVVVNGGAISEREAAEAMSRGWRVAIVRGSGGAADRLARAAGEVTGPPDEQAVVDIADGGARLARVLTRMLDAPR